MKYPQWKGLTRCCVCGGKRFIQKNILWKELIQDWELSDDEVTAINQQQGYMCTTCRSNLRSINLAAAVMHEGGVSCAQLKHETFDHFCRSSSFSKTISLLEINSAYTLTSRLKHCAHHTLASYPKYDMQHISLPSHTYDVVLHADTLEHVQNKEKGLKECYRVLKKGGALLCTIPIVLTKLTRSRVGMKPSYHGKSFIRKHDYFVYTEFGADFWTYFLDAGFSSLELFTISGPNSIVIIARK